jgi:Outer membrane protein beta-barrel domain
MVYRMPFVVLLLLLMSGISVNAQFQLPQFDVEIKGQQNLIPGDGQNDGDLQVAETTNIYGAAHVQLGQHIAVGGFFSKSLRGTGKFSLGQGDVTHDILFLQKGIDLRLSTGRARNWRPYLSLNYSKIEIVEDNGGYRIASKTNAFGGSLGIMRKLGSKLYLTVIELGAKSMSDEIFWFSTSDKLIIDLKMGLLYNIGKKK